MCTSLVNRNLSESIFRKVEMGEWDILGILTILWPCWYAAGVLLIIRYRDIIYRDIRYRDIK